MILVLFFCGIFLLISFLTLIVLLSTIRITIDKLFITNYNEQQDSKQWEKDFVIYFGLYLFGKIKLFQTRLTDERLEKMSQKLDIKNKIEKLDFETLKGNFKLDKESLRIIKDIKIDITQFNLDLKIGTENVILTSGIVAFLSTIFSVILSKIIPPSSLKHSKYQIMPIYHNQNQIKVDLNCIINVKMVHIIYIMFHLLKKGRVNKHGGTSNRRSYDYSYE